MISSLEVAATKEVFEVLQVLYEKHKLLTYPRSDNQFLSDAHLENAPQIFTAIQGTIPHLSDTITQTVPSSTHKAFNTTKIEAHHAIVPIEKSGAD
ncbi:DNA topoisomerase [Vibrio harveyi]